jgi:outer membrane protein
MEMMTGGAGIKDSYGIKLSLDQLLFDFGRTSAAVREANLNVIAARERLRLAQGNVVYQVRVSFYELVKAEALLRAAEEEVKQFGARLEQTRVMHEVGRLTGYEVTKSEVNLGNAQAGLLKAQNALSTARASLNRAMGLAEDPGYKVEPPEMEDLDRSLEDLMDEARNHNPEYLALTAEDKMASAVVDQTISDLFPKITLKGELSWNGSEFPLSYGWSLAPAIIQTLYDGFRNINKIDQTAARLRSAHARQAAKEQDLYLELSKGLAQLMNARERVRVAEAVVKEAALNREQVEDRYRVGRASLLELTDAQLTLTQAHAELAQARYDLQSAIALLRLSTGEDIP